MSKLRMMVFLLGVMVCLSGCAESESYRRELAGKIKINAFLLYDLTEDLLHNYMQVRNHKRSNWKEMRIKLENLEKMVPLLRDQSHSARESADDRIKQLCTIEDNLFVFFQQDILKKFLEMQKFLEETALPVVERDTALDEHLAGIKVIQEEFRRRKTDVEGVVEKLFPEASGTVPLPNED